MIELVCIACPNGCLMKVEKEGNELSVNGNKCPKGISFAKNELLNPTRSVSTTIRTIFKDLPVVPVRTNGEIAKDKIMALMSFLKTIVIDKRLKRGDTVIQNYDASGVDIIITTDMR